MRTGAAIEAAEGASLDAATRCHLLAQGGKEIVCLRVRLRVGTVYFAAISRKYPLLVAGSVKQGAENASQSAWAKKRNDRAVLQ